MKQTAVKYLEEKLDIMLPLDFEWDKLEKIINQAKEIEKEQIIDAWIATDNEYGIPKMAAERYYNETYGGNNES